MPTFPVPSMPPQDVRVLDLVTQSSIQVTWRPVLPGYVNGILQGYKLTYQLITASDQHMPDEKENILTLNPHNLSITIQHLRSFSVYKIKVAAFTRQGTGSFSDYVTAGKSVSISALCERMRKTTIAGDRKCTCVFKMHPKCLLSCSRIKQNNVKNNDKGVLLQNCFVCHRFS